MGKTVKWGIMGTGWMANRFLQDFPKAESCIVQGIASRNIANAKKVIEKNNLDHAVPFGSYQALADNPDIDIIYITTPHTFHMENTLMALTAGKAVLCEKPIAINSAQLAKMIECATVNNCFLMEGMWTRFLPVINKVKKLITSNKLGEPRQLSANFCNCGDQSPKGRYYNPALAGGGLLDLGIYTLFMAQYIFKDDPQKLEAFVQMSDTGIDREMAILMQYPEGELAQLSCAINYRSPWDAIIACTGGTVHIPDFFMANKANIITDDEVVDTIEDPDSGYQYEINEVNNCIRSGQKESKLWPLESSIKLIKMLDRIRDHIGLVYPME